MRTKLHLMAAMLVLGATTVKAQLNVGSTSAPNGNAMLQVTSTTKGLLLPSVSLTSTGSFNPLTAHVAGMIVYNTASANDVTPGYYYDNGSAWVRVGNAASQDLFAVGVASHLTSDAGVGAAGTNAGTGGLNIGIGFESLFSITSGSDNVAVGPSALYGVTSGVNNVAIGNTALGANNTGSQNTALGALAQQNGVVFNSTAIGFEALNGSSGSGNTGVGALALHFNSTGSFNTATGDSAMNANTTGSNSVAIGYQALTANTTGTNNTALGYQAGVGNVSGSNNVLLGYNTGVGNPLGDNNILIGNSVIGQTFRNGSNQLNIGNWIYANGSNHMGLMAPSNPNTSLFVPNLPKFSSASAALTGLSIGVPGSVSGALYQTDGTGSGVYGTPGIVMVVP